MFHLFRQITANETKAKAFVSWFASNSDRIKASVENKDHDRNTMISILDEVELQLAKVYRDGYKGQIEFDYGGKNEEWCLNLYHKNNRFLIQATETIASRFNQIDHCEWTVHTDV